ncbi:hypothetical protein F4811DRAFT_549617 [Daldinia bambusicola]|nr:hypothetical protein F4811DRAFT_549617 [Daldinia bambusicola]
MEHTISQQSLTPSSFRNFPVEVVQGIMCHLSWKSLVRLTSLSPSLLFVFEGDRKRILHRIAARELGTEIFEASLVRYACTVPSLKEALDIVVEFHARPLDPTIYLNDKWTFDLRKFRLPPEFWTMAVFRDIMDFHERVLELIDLYEGWIRENAAKSHIAVDLATRRTPEEVARVPMAVYAMEITRLLYPDKYAESGEDALIVCFNGDWKDWVLLAHEASFNPPFIIGGQKMLNAWSLYIPSAITEETQH